MTFAALEKQKSSLMRLGPIRSPPAEIPEPSIKSSQKRIIKIKRDTRYFERKRSEVNVGKKDTLKLTFGH